VSDWEFQPQLPNFPALQRGWKMGQRSEQRERSAKGALPVLRGFSRNVKQDSEASITVNFLHRAIPH
jgi:hypothetical protein